MVYRRCMVGSCTYLILQALKVGESVFILLCGPFFSLSS